MQGCGDWEEDENVWERREQGHTGGHRECVCKAGIVMVVLVTFSEGNME